MKNFKGLLATLGMLLMVGVAFLPGKAIAGDITAVSVTGVTGNPASYGTGSVVTYSLTLTKGGANTQSLTAAGLPTGASYVFTPASISASGPVTLKITTASSTPAGSYTLTIGANTVSVSTALVINKQTVVPNVTLDNKTYDGTTGATSIASRSLSGVVGSDNVTLGTSGTVAAFSSKNVGSYTPTVSGLTLSGTAAANYTLSTTTVTPSASITARAITVTAATNSKQYDGNTSAAATPTITSGSLASGDTANFTESYSSKTLGTGNKTLVPAGSVTDGNSGNNYSVTFVNNTTGTISAKSLTATGITAANKEYDGTTAATLNTDNKGLSGVVAGETVTLDASSAAGIFASAAPGTWQVTINGLSLGGADVGNYSLAQATTTATITDAAAAFDQASPASNAYINTATVGYNLSKTIVNGTGTITFTRTDGVVDASSPHVYHFTASDLSAGTHSINTGFTLANAAIYTMEISAADDQSVAAGTVSNTNILFDASAASVTINAPASSSYVNNASTTYTLSKDVQAGTIVYTRTAGSADGAAHSYPLSGDLLKAGQHTVDTGLALVDGAVYSVNVQNVVDLEGNSSNVVTNTGVTFDTTAVALTNVAPTASSDIVNANVIYSLSDQAYAGTITFTRTGGAADPAPHVYTMTSADLAAGDHTVVTDLPLVVGAIYTMNIDVADQAGNHASIANASQTMVLLSVALTPDQPTPYTGPGVTVNFTATVTGTSSNYEYQFYKRDSSTGNVWVATTPGYTPSNVYQLTTTVADIYSVYVNVRNVGSNVPVQASKGMSFTVLDNTPVNSVSLGSDTASPQTVAAIGGKTVTFTALAAGGNGVPQYRFTVQDASKAIIQQQGYDADPSNSGKFYWTAPSQAGTYTITVSARNVGSSMDYEAVKGITFAIQANSPVTAATIAASPGTYQALAADAPRFHATATGGTGTPYFQFLASGPSTGNVLTVVQSYSTSADLYWKPATAGTYKITVYARSEGNSKAYEASAYTSYTYLANAPVTSVTLTGSTKSTTLASSAQVTFTASASGSGSPQYQFYVKSPSDAGYVLKQDYSATNTFSLTPTMKGTYQVLVQAKTAGSPLAKEASTSTNLIVQ